MGGKTAGKRKQVAHAMDNDIFHGQLTSLSAVDPDEFGTLYAKWSRDSEFLRLFDSDAPVPRDAKRTQDWLRAESEKARPGNFDFVIRRRDNAQIIGVTALTHASSPHRNAWFAIGLGERELWGRGYGSDAMQLILGFGFRDLNLHRVNLNTFQNNPRAIRAYEKFGFVHEGRVRGALRRDGQRGDIIFMGLLRAEWENRHG
jgi:RimJ/RimL family protein N-acetyltransferase